MAGKALQRERMITAAFRKYWGCKKPCRERERVIIAALEKAFWLYAEMSHLLRFSSPPWLGKIDGYLC